MKGIRSIVVFIFIFFTLLFLSEFSIFDLKSLETNFNRSQISYDNSVTLDEIKNDINQAYEKTSINMFFIEKDYTDLTNPSINIYGTANVESYFQNNLNINNGIHKSLFMGDISIYFYSIDDITMDNIDNKVYFFDFPLKSNEFKKALNLNVDVSYVIPAQKDSFSFFMTISLYTLLFSIFLILTLYYLNFTKKEILLKLVSGTNFSTIILKNIIFDFVLLYSNFAISFFILKNYTSVFFHTLIFSKVLFIIFIFNIFVNLSILSFEYRMVYRNDFYSKKIIVVNYFFKVLVTSLGILLIISNLSFISAGISFTKQKTFFENYKNYSYANYNLYTNQNKNISYDMLFYEFYKKAYDEGNTFSLRYFYDVNKHSLLVADKNTIDYLKSEIKEIENYDFKEKVYLLLPSNLKKEDVYSIFGSSNTLSFFSPVPYNGSDVEYIYYDSNVSLISTNLSSGKFPSTFTKSKPIVLLNAFSSIPTFENLETNFNVYREPMYNVSKDDFITFVTGYGLNAEQYSYTGVNDKYIEELSIIKNILNMNLFFIVLIILLNLLLLYVVLHYEYIINIREITIKKILGYRIFSRIHKIFLSVIITSTFTITLTFLLAKLGDFKDIKYILTSGLIFISIELLLMVYFTNKIEKDKVVKYLKGGL